MTSELTSEVAVALLMLLLVSVLAVAVFFVVSYARHVRLLGEPSRRKKDPEPPVRSRECVLTLLENPVRWLAIKSSNVSAVQATLGLHHPAPCTWDEGFSRLAEHSLFVSPPIQGWILVIGQALPDPSEDIDDCYRLLARWSSVLGQVQFFSANRAVNHHAWVQMDDGRVRRAYAWAEETLWNQGSVTQAEIDLGLKCFGYGESAEALSLNGGDSHHANADKLVFLAARWSLDPTSITEGMMPKTHGVIGELYHSKKQR